MILFWGVTDGLVVQVEWPDSVISHGVDYPGHDELAGGIDHNRIRGNLDIRSNGFDLLALNEDNAVGNGPARHRQNRPALYGDNPLASVGGSLDHKNGDKKDSYYPEGFFLLMHGQYSYKDFSLLLRS